MPATARAFAATSELERLRTARYAAITIKHAPSSMSSMEMPENDSRLVTALIACSGDAKCSTEKHPPITIKAREHTAPASRTFAEPPKNSDRPTNANSDPPVPAVRENRTRGH